MHRTTLALVAASALAGWTQPLDSWAQTGTTGQQTDPAGRVTQQELEAYARVREQLMQNPNVEPMLRQPEDLQAQALERYLSREGAGMSAEDFVRIHREVMSDPNLKAQVESGSLSGAGASGSQPSGSPQ